MKSVLICTFDTKLAQFNTPMSFPNRAVAERAIRDAVKPDTDFGKHPEDYEFYAVGTFDSDSGAIEAYPQPQLFFLATDFAVMNGID